MKIRLTRVLCGVAVGALLASAFALSAVAPAGAEDKPVRVDVDKIKKADDAVIKTPRAKDFVDPSKAKLEVPKDAKPVVDKFVDPSKSTLDVPKDAKPLETKFVDPSKATLPAPPKGPLPVAPGVPALEPQEKPASLPKNLDKESGAAADKPDVAATPPSAKAVDKKERDAATTTKPVVPGKPDLKDAPQPGAAPKTAPADKTADEKKAGWREWLPW